MPGPDPAQHLELVAAN
ncbi:hypothetical protein CUMW_046080 [Citrus unshiu]|nr:hypothetical protein CUMW_046080 [Citrus unshiu]